MHELDQKIDELARSPILLVASDFDGTIAPIVSDPALAEADRESIVALKALAAMPQTHVAIVSGRALSDLALRTADTPNLHLVGSHGSEFEPGVVIDLDEAAEALLDRLNRELTDIAARAAGTAVEVKPAGLAFHYRNADDATAAAAVERIMAGPATWSGVHVREGKKVVELSVVATDKGRALQRLRQRLGASAVLFLGDDVTDEDAFVTLAGPDAGVKVGPGDTRAAFRIDSTFDASRLLARLTDLRADWLAGAEAVPIEHHSLLSDQRTCALVDPHGRIVWLCLPRIDSSAVFSELLGGPSAGFLDIRPIDANTRPRQRYVGDSMILQTEWPALRVLSYLDCGGGRASQRAGRTDLVSVIEGRGRARIIFAPRLDFGRMITRLRPCESGVEIEGALDSIVLYGAGVKWQIVDEGRHQTAIGEIDVSYKPVVLELRYGTGNLSEAAIPEATRRQRVMHFWSNWADTLTLPSAATDLVRRSAITLNALCYGPTGAIAAAATTSLPEHAGGSRNWDYRFCWPRDAAMSAASLARLGATGPGLRLLDWLLAILEHSDQAAMLAPVYTVTGAHLSSEGEITELAGYCGSRPVRVGNAAAHQVQLDVFGPIVELIALLAERGEALSSEHWRMTESIVGAVAARWREPDHGIWEVRTNRRHHVHSKVMCWLTVDRGLRVARYLGRRRDEWTALREEIAQDVLTHGFNERIGAFGATYEFATADASALSVGLSGLLAPDDPRVIRTIDYVEKQLREGPIVYRYRYDDGLPGVEGGFLICTAWLIEAYAMMGRHDDAATLFEQYAALAGPTGLLPEQYDPHRRQALGNYPQAYSHLGLIDTALRLVN
jgi:trehalose-phosphatase